MKTDAACNKRVSEFRVVAFCVTASCSSIAQQRFNPSGVVWSWRRWVGTMTMTTMAARPKRPFQRSSILLCVHVLSSGRHRLHLSSSAHRSKLSRWAKRFLNFNVKRARYNGRGIINSWWDLINNSCTHSGEVKTLRAWMETKQTPHLPRYTIATRWEREMIEKMWRRN